MDLHWAVPLREAGDSEILVALKHYNFQVRGFAALAIGRMGNDAKDALPAIRELRNNGHPGVLTAAEDTSMRVEY